MRTLPGRARLLLNQMAIRPLETLRALAAVPAYVRDLLRFRRSSTWDIHLHPCFFDRSASAATLGEYFWQDLYVARRILGAAPARHIDVGSRIDGFVAHLACQRQVEVYDIRPLQATIPNVRFHRWDMTAQERSGPEQAADSVSCLHTLEHVGLGRYGDAIAPEAWRVALARLADIVQPAGCLWLSVPVGRRRVEFNAHRIFDPREIRDFALGLGLVLGEFSVIRDDRQQFPATDAEWNDIAGEPYALGIYQFFQPPAA